MTDLEWLATHLGWTGVHHANGGLMGYPSGSPTALTHFPRYDQSIDLMVKLVERLPLDQQDSWYVWLWRLEGCSDLFAANAKAYLRLRAYRHIVEGNDYTTEGEDT